MDELQVSTKILESHNQSQEKDLNVSKSNKFYDYLY